MGDKRFGDARLAKAREIPVIDVSPAVQRSEFEVVAREIQQAATKVGFFYIANHGIDPALIDKASDAAHAFFALPQAMKATVEVDKEQRGWMKTGMARLEGAATHDLKEVFFWGAEVPPNHPDLLAQKPLVAENRWPNAVFARLQQDLVPYYNAVCTVAEKVLCAIAVGFGQDADFFKSRYDMPLARGQLVYYPPSSQEHEQEQRFGVAPHTDFGVLTLLLQDNNGGLQVKSKSGDWIEAPPIPGTLVCNIGDLLQRWSNDRFISTLHRVINRSGRERYSIPVFFDPHTDAIIDPCDLGVNRKDSKHPPVKAGEHIAARNAKNFTQYQR